MAHRCDKCGIASFETRQAYQRHILTNKHKMRQENTRQDLFQCKRCTKWYCGTSGLSHHKQICRSNQNQNQKQDLKQDIPPAEELRIDIQNANLQQQINELKQALGEVQATREQGVKRKKINKVTRQQHIADRQKNRC